MPAVVRICLLRHAEAVDERRDLYDGARYLSAAGRQAAVLAGRQLAGYWRDAAAAGLIAADALSFVASPLVRAMQTAELAAATFGPECDVVCEPMLAPSNDIVELAAKLRARAAQQVIIVVGHEPGLSALGAEITGDVNFPMLDKGESVLIENGKLQWCWQVGAARPR